MSKHRTRTTGWERLLSGVLCLALALGLLPAAGMVQTAEAAEHWADPYAQQLVEWGVMSAASDLRLSDVATRAEFVAMCNRAFGYSRLGGTPFTDVPSTAWYAQDIDIAYNAGYFKGISDSAAYPGGTLTREQAAVLLGRCMRLQESVGEGLDFTDSHDLSEWSRGLVAAAVAEGIITGYGDGSYHPASKITRGELAVMLVRAIGTPVGAAGSYELDDVYGNVTISSSDVTLRDTVILGNLYVTGGVDLGNVLLENVTVLGRIVIAGGGVSDAARSSVILRNVAADELVVDSLINQFVTVSAYGLTDISLTSVRSDTYLEDSCADGYGLHYIEQDGAKLLQLAGGIKEVLNKTPGSSLQLVKGTAETITIDELATNSELLIDINTRVDVLNLDVATLVTGQGDIIQLNIGADGCEVDILPERVEIRPGLAAEVDGKTIGSTAASELSSEPRLMAGYPKVDDLKFDQTKGRFQVNGLFSGNKPGTIYWAVSEVADGSVSMEDLLKNPSYGGNIYEDNAGSIGAESKLVYVQQITELLPDGSYYVSAVMVDERNNRSPLKVVSFSVPDNTQPAFVEDPHMTLVSCATAQVSTMVNKSCDLYWVLLAHGAVPPTVQNFKSGSFGGGYYGYGSQSVVKNVPVSITVNMSRLRENTGYDLYLWLSDFDGTLTSAVHHVLNKDTKKDADPTFITPDETPPIVTRIMQNDFDQETAIGFIFAINEAPSTLYWAVVEETNNAFMPDDELNTLLGQMRMESGTGTLAHGNMKAAGVNVETQVAASVFNNQKLDPSYGHNFKLYYMAKDDAGNCSEVRYITVHTKDNENPTVTLSFPENKMSGGKPKADTDIILTFSEQVKGDMELDSDTFADLYAKVKVYQDLIDAGNDNSANRDMLADAKAALAEELEKHITLYYVENVGGRLTEKDLKAPKRDASGQLAEDQEEHGWVDWGEAIVELRRIGTTGKVVLTLPAGKAVTLGGGMEYYFHFKDIYDDSYDHNLLDVVDENGKVTSSSTNNNGECETAHFTTVFAQIWLSRNTSVTTAIVEGEVDPIRLDFCIDVAPESTKNVPSTVVWDMIIWSENVLTFELYRRTGNSGNWELVEINTTNNDNAFDMYDDGGMGYGVGAKKNVYGDETKRYETVRDGLSEDLYQYGIHITSINSVMEEDRQKKPEIWNSPDTIMRFAIIAGDWGNIDVVSGTVPPYEEFNSAVEGTVSVISTATDPDTGELGTILRCRQSYTDMRAPSFQSTYPMFTNITANSFMITALLDRPGTVYFVVAQAPSTNIGESTSLIPVFIKDDVYGSVTVDIHNDGSKFDFITEDKDRWEAIRLYFEEGIDVTVEKPEEETEEVPGADDQETDQDAEPDTGEPGDGEDGEAKKKYGNLENPPTYIPTGGTDREANKDYIYYYDDDGGKIYDGLGWRNIRNGNYGGNIKKGEITVPVDLSSQNRTITNLDPETEYYVYMVLQGQGASEPDHVVQVYRVTTKEASPPIVSISPGVLSASITTYDGAETSGSDRRNPVDSEVYWVLVNMSSLPPFLSYTFAWDYDEATKEPTRTYTLLQMLTNRTGGATNNQSLFVAHANDAYRVEDGKVTSTAAVTYRSDLVDFIMEQGEYANSTLYKPRNSGHDNYIANGDRVSATFLEGDEPTNPDETYGVLAMARVDGAGDGDENLGFSAYSGIAVPDPDPPELKTDSLYLIDDGTGTRFNMSIDVNAVYWYNNNISDWSKSAEGGWQTSPKGKDEFRQTYKFDATLKISFDKAVYQYLDNGNGTYSRRQVVASKSDVTDPAMQVAFEDAVRISTPNHTDLSYSVEISGGDMTITFKNLRYNDTIYILGSGLITNSNPNGNRSNKTLRLVFDPAMTGASFGLEGIFANTYYGGFEATWR